MHDTARADAASDSGFSARVFDVRTYVPQAESLGEFVLPAPERVVTRCPGQDP